MNLGKLTLKRQIILIISFSAIFICSIQIFYYYNFINLTQTRSADYEKKIMDQTYTKVDSILKDIKVNAEIIISDSRLQKFVLSNDYYNRNAVEGPLVLDLINYVRSFNSNIYSVQIQDNQERSIYSDPNSESFIYNSQQYLEFIRDYKVKVDELKQPQFTNIMTQEGTGKKFFFYIAPIIETLGGVDFSKRIAYCTIMISTDKINEYIRNTELTPNSSLFILNDENVIIASNKVDKEGKVFDIGLPTNTDDLARGFKTVVHGDQVMIQQKSFEQIPGWRIVSIIPIKELTSDMKSMKYIGFNVGIGMTVILFILGYFFFRNITRPIFKIIREMDKVREHQVGYRLKVYSTNEVGILAAEINNMMDNIEEATQNILTTQARLYEVELSKRNAEFSALQSQINPHFLYNTLNCISSIGLAYGSKEIVQITSCMSKIFRYSIKEEDLVSISQEIECINAYINIISIRYANKFLMEVSVDENILEKKMPKIILQPIVENSVYHGLEHMDKGGQLTVNGFLNSDGDVCFKIFDSGKGISESKLKSIREKLSMGATDSLLSRSKGESIGLVNVNNRIKLLFGENYGIEIDSKEYCGTTVTIKIPCIDAD